MAKQKTNTTSKSARTKTSASKKSASARPPGPRRLRPPHYKPYQLRRKVKIPKKILPSSFKLWRQSAKLLFQNWKLFGMIALVYGLLALVLVHGLSSNGIDLNSIKKSLHIGSNSQGADVVSGLSIFGYLLGTTSTSNTPNGDVYQTMLVILVSLATIWGLRQVLAGKAIKARDTFYKGVYPLIPFCLVLLVIGLQLLPFAIGSWLYSIVITNGIAVSFWEKCLALLVFFLLTLWSLYMLCSSIFALYIAALPDMTPLKALRSAKQLVSHRRFMVLRKIIFLPFSLLVIGAVIMVPLVLFLTVVANWIFFGLSVVALLVVHGYMYTLYRELL